MKQYPAFRLLRAPLCRGIIAAIAIGLAVTAARAEWPLPQAAYSAEGTMEAAGMRIHTRSITITARNAGS